MKVYVVLDLEEPKKDCICAVTTTVKNALAVVEEVKEFAEDPDRLTHIEEVELPSHFCPYCGSSETASSFKHVDLIVDDSSDTEHTDVMIYRCGSCRQVYAEAY